MEAGSSTGATVADEEQQPAAPISAALSAHLQGEHERRVAEQSALVRALREVFASEPALAGSAPVFPALTSNIRGYRTEYGKWTEPSSLGARLVVVVQRERRAGRSLLRRDKQEPTCSSQ